MDLKEASITFLVGSDITRIDIHDETSGITFCSIQLTPEQLSSALSRISHTRCQAAVRGLDKLNKTHEHKTFEFEIPAGRPYNQEDRKVIESLARAACPDGWVPDLSFNSQNSFFSKDGKNYARTFIRRWV